MPKATAVAPQSFKNLSPTPSQTQVMAASGASRVRERVLVRLFVWSVRSAGGDAFLVPRGVAHSRLVCRGNGGRIHGGARDKVKGIAPVRLGLFRLARGLLREGFGLGKCDLLFSCGTVVVRRLLTFRAIAASLCRWTVPAAIGAVHELVGGDSAQG